MPFDSFTMLSQYLPYKIYNNSGNEFALRLIEVYWIDCGVLLEDEGSHVAHEIFLDFYVLDILGHLHQVECFHLFVVVLDESLALPGPLAFHNHAQYFFGGSG
jgi:hypothetical protein